MDNDTKQNIIDMEKFISPIYDVELTKELDKQKNEGKQFLSDEDIDNIVNSVLYKDITGL